MRGSKSLAIELLLDFNAANNPWSPSSSTTFTPNDSSLKNNSTMFSQPALAAITSADVFLPFFSLSHTGIVNAAGFAPSPKSASNFAICSGDACWSCLNSRASLSKHL